MIKSACSFFGHREIKVTRKIKKELYDSIEDLIVNDNRKKPDSKKHL